MTPITGRVIAGCGPTFTDQAGPLLPVLLDCLLDPAAEIEQLTGDMFHLDRSPIPGWLGEVTGTPVPAGLSIAQQRQYVRDAPAQKRGHPNAIKAAARTWLRGGRRVTLNERTPTAYSFQVRVYASEVIDEDRLREAILAAKPFELILDLDIVEGASYEHMTEFHGPTYAAEKALYPTYEQALQHLPEEI